MPSSSSPGSGFVALGQRNSLVGVKIKETATSSARSAERAVVCFIFKARANVAVQRGQCRVWKTRSPVEASVFCTKCNF